MDDLCAMEHGTTLVLGASTRPGRYANLCVQRLVDRGFPVVAVGLRSGMVGAVPILTDIPGGISVGTLSLYVGPAHQAAWVGRILELAPRRIIFNPGTENEEFELRAKEAGILVVRGCTLVMLSVGTY